MKWTDSEEIGIALAEKFPGLDPLTIRFDLVLWTNDSVRRRRYVTPTLGREGGEQPLGGSARNRTARATDSTSRGSSSASLRSISSRMRCSCSDSGMEILLSQAANPL